MSLAAQHAPLVYKIAAKHGVHPAALARHIDMTQNSKPVKPRAPRTVPRPPRTSNGLSIQSIDRFIGTGNPLAQAGGARTLLRATGGSLEGAAFLAALARKESSFGAQAFAPNNFWGYGVHLGPSVNTALTVEAMAAKVWRGLNSGLYKGAGLTTPSAIIAKYAPPSENNTALYQQQVNQWFGQLGLSPSTNIFSGSGGRTPADATGASSPPVASLQQSLPALDVQRLAGILNATRTRVLAGQMPQANYTKEIQKLLAGVAPSQQVATTTQGVGTRVQQVAQTVAGYGQKYGTPFGTTFTLPGFPSSVPQVRSTGSITNPKGQQVATTTFDGKPVSEWWASVLTFARKHGWKGTVNSGYRSVAEQTAIWNRHPDPRWVAHPGSSPHNYGMAVDISDGPGLERIIRQYKLPVARYAPEGWHFEPLGFRTNGTQKTFT